MQRELMKRQALYDVVWSVPIDRLAATFELSGNGIRKVCLRHHIPTPSRGYWAKLRAGKPTERIPLPPLEPGAREWVVIAPRGTPYAQEGLAWLDEQLALQGYGGAQTQVREPAAPEFEADLHVLEWRTLRAMGRVRVRTGELHSSLHTSVAKLLEADRFAREAVWPVRRVVFRGKETRRRLAFANALLLAIERAGHRGSVTDPEARAIDCIVHHQSITIRLESKTMRTKNDPNGRERLDINVRGKNAYRLRSEWNERRSFVPEEHIARIASGTVLAAELERRDAEYARYREQRRMWEERVKEQREVEQAAKRKATETLLVQATAFRQAKEIRELVAAAHRIGSGCLEFAHWQAWALQEADRLDPLAGGTPPWSHPDGNSTPNGAKRYSRTG